jgi:hypothetical protein
MLCPTSNRRFVPKPEVTNGADELVGRLVCPANGTNRLMLFLQIASQSPVGVILNSITSDRPRR